MMAAVGDKVSAGDPVLELHYRDKGKLEQAIGRAIGAIAIGDEKPAAQPLILDEVR